MPSQLLVQRFAVFTCPSQLSYSSPPDPRPHHNPTGSCLTVKGSVAAASEPLVASGTYTTRKFQCGALQVYSNTQLEAIGSPHSKCTASCTQPAHSHIHSVCSPSASRFGHPCCTAKLMASCNVNHAMCQQQTHDSTSNSRHAPMSQVGA